MRSKKFFALPLALALVLSLCVGAPAAAGAAGVSRFWGTPTSLPKKSKTHSQVTTDTAPGSVGSTGKAGTSGVAIITSLGPVCEIGGVPYDTLDDALATIAPNTPTTITLLADIDYTDSLSLTNRTITFDLAGFNLNFDCATDIALDLTNCTIDYTGAGSFNVASSADYDPNTDTGGVSLSVDGGSCHVTSVSNTGFGSAAVICMSSGTVVVDGPVSASGDDSIGVAADIGSTITVNGDISATLGGIIASGSNIKVKGNITVKGPDAGFGIDIEDFASMGTAPLATVKMTGDITVEGSDPNGFVVGLMLNAKSDTTMNGNISAKGNYGMGISADFGSTVTMTGNITGSGSSHNGSIDGIDTYDANVSLTGAIAVDGAGIFAIDGTTKVTGNITTSSDGSAIDAEGGIVSVTGAVKTTGDYTSAIYADTSKVTVNGAVTAAGKDGYGVEAYDGAKVTVSGNVTADGYGASALDRGTEVYIKGNIVSKGSAGASVDDRATVTVDGTITAATDYVEVGALTKEKEDFTTPTTKAGYKTYTDGKSTVWVLDTSTPKPPISPKPKPQPQKLKTPGGGLPSTGDVTDIAAPGALLIGAIAASVLVGMKRRANKES
ncbi:MAG: hypothetical protein FWF45_06330 [Coriobacteriia bacterium]|nr:hypothetical protein [Coriobacteriia bacterium]